MEKETEGKEEFILKEVAELTKRKSKKKQKRKRQVKLRKTDKPWFYPCQLCGKEIQIVHRRGKHLTLNEIEEKNEDIFSFTMGIIKCPFCGKELELKHKSVNYHLLL